MPLRSTGLKPSKISTIRICVDSRRAMEPEGALYLLNKGIGIPFYSLSDLVLKMDLELDKDDFPQAHFKYRSFSEDGESRVRHGHKMQKEKLMDNIELDLTGGKSGERATFVVEVMFRRNATWQGRIEWIDKRQSRHFRSSLELMKLIDEALSIEYGEDEEYQGWDKP